MKKSLLALAVLGAFAASAQAQTNVTVGGIVQANVKGYQVGQGNAVAPRGTATEIRVDDDYTSRFWLTGTEVLGGGNSALFYVENRLNTDVSSATGTGNGLANGDTFLGLKGAWGQATIGKHSLMSVQGLTTEILTGSGITAMPTSMFGTYTLLNQHGGYLDITRRQNSVVYRLPAMSGFNGTFAYSPNSGGNEGTFTAGTAGSAATTQATCVIGGVTYLQSTLVGTCAANGGAAGAAAPLAAAVAATAANQNYAAGQEYYIQGGYANGPLSLSLAYRQFKVEGRTGTDAKQARLSGYYKFPMGLKIGANIDQSTTQAVVANVGAPESKRVAWTIPVSYAFGSSTVMASYNRAGETNLAVATGAKMYVLGYDYALSKRTNVGVYAAKLSNDTQAAYQPFLAGTSLTGSALAAGESATTYAVGVKHTF